MPKCFGSEQTAADTMENLKLIFRLYFAPSLAMSDIMDKGNWLFAALAMLLVSFVFQFAVSSRIAQDYAVTKFDQYIQNSNFDRDTTGSGRLTEAQLEEARYIADIDIDAHLHHRPFPILGRNVLYLFSFEALFISPLISLSLFFVPALLLLTRLLGAAAYTSTNMRNNYMPLATCTTMAWVAAHLPFAIAGTALTGQPVDGSIYLIMWLLSGVTFAALTMFGTRTVLGINYAPAAVIVILSLLAFPFGMYVFRYVQPHLLSPFLIIMVVIYFGGFFSSEARGFGNAFRQKQNLKRFLHNATVNPNDADAHVQLGLIYLQRRQETKAIEHFDKALEIDKTEIDANYEMGKIARSKGDLQNALDHFAYVVEQSDQHALSEIWREIGATYLAANMINEASESLRKFVERRSGDVEGLYYFGMALKASGEIGQAREMFQAAVEPANLPVDFRLKNTKHWTRLAQKELRSLDS